jgi:gamma-glutamylcyclotransferase (GGCT)/AIG2-like uncharacterized protein YtfP
MSRSASSSMETTHRPTPPDATGVEALPAISVPLPKINKIDEFRKRAKALGLDVRHKKPDGNGWAWRSREDVLKDYARKLVETRAATSASMPGSASSSMETTHRPTPPDASGVEALPAISELEKINKIDEFRKRAKALGLDVRHKQPDGNGWAWRSREDVLKDYARKLVETRGATLPSGTGSVPQTAGASSSVLRKSSTIAAASASAAVHGEVGKAASSRLGDLQVPRAGCDIAGMVSASASGSADANVDALNPGAEFEHIAMAASSNTPASVGVQTAEIADSTSSSVSDIVMAELSVLDRLGCRSTRDEFRKRARALGVAVEGPVMSTGKRPYRKKADILEDCRRALTEKHSEVQQEAPWKGLFAHQAPNSAIGDPSEEAPTSSMFPASEVIDLAEVWAGKARSSGAVETRGGRAIRFGLQHGHNFYRRPDRDRVEAELADKKNKAPFAHANVQVLGSLEYLQCPKESKVPKEAHEVAGAGSDSCQLADETLQATGGSRGRGPH